MIEKGTMVPSDYGLGLSRVREYLPFVVTTLSHAVPRVVSICITI